MTGSWILIVALHTASGQFVDKLSFDGFATKKACMAVKIQDPDQLKLRKVCVSKAHWEGRTIDPGVNPD